MKMVSGTVVAVLILAASAMAQTPPAPPAAPPPTPSATCASVPAPPPAPDGATISHQEMTRQRALLDAWQLSYTAVRERCEAENQALVAQANANVAAFSAAQAGFPAITAAWVTQVEVFNARGVSRRRERDPRSVN
jgi:hypothetical protein